jgi:hypothetical protein
VIRAWVLVLFCAGCSDIFALPVAGLDLGGGDGGSSLEHDLGGDGNGGDLALPVGADLALDPSLPAACAMLPCRPDKNEGNVTLSGGTITGCHAYDHLLIATLATVRAQRLFVCANDINIAGILDASGAGDSAGVGSGAGSTCNGESGAAGGGHGGGGADPAGCGGGAPFGDKTRPREPGSGGGGPGGGAGGGVIELAAPSINVLTLIRADGSDGSGASAGGGSGGSVLLEADTVLGGGGINVRGGRGAGTRGGGGGGGRVAIYAGVFGARFNIDAAGGASTSGGAGGTGTITQ